ncbi:MAG TPA: PfkB family carbohydrate kinase [Bacteroidota bacterium]|nr:PfkB family carbohydrate kinase [Bacteroidota bacterium]
MSLLVVGSLAFDTIETPFGKVEEALGGSATYISTAASYFASPVRLVGVVGGDFPNEAIDFLNSRNIDTDGIETDASGKTFRWGGRYHYDLNSRDTLFTHLNVFEHFDPKIPVAYKSSKFVCLGNIDPILQRRVLEQIDRPKLVVGDTMNFWIERKRDELVKTIEMLDVLIINDSEARLLAEEPNLFRAAKKILAMGTKALIIKKGEHGALLITHDTVFSAPAYPLESIFDPTGAGDTFAGGFIGFLAKIDDITDDCLKKAVIYGSTMASFCVEQFSLEALKDLTYLKIQDRYREFRMLSRFED